MREPELVDSPSRRAPNAARPPRAERSPGAPEGQRWLLALGGWLLATAALEARDRAGRAPPEPPGGVLPRAADLRRASHRDLRRLPGVGPLLALEIERARWEAGGLEDLEEVRGIGPRIAEGIASWLEAQGAERQPPSRARAPPGE